MAGAERSSLKTCNETESFALGRTFHLTASAALVAAVLTAAAISRVSRLPFRPNLPGTVSHNLGPYRGS